jgi:hypothetical protein
LNGRQQLGYEVLREMCQFKALEITKVFGIQQKLKMISDIFLNKTISV